MALIALPKQPREGFILSSTSFSVGRITSYELFFGRRTLLVVSMHRVTSLSRITHTSAGGCDLFCVDLQFSFIPARKKARSIEVIHTRGA